MARSRPTLSAASKKLTTIEPAKIPTCLPKRRITRRGPIGIPSGGISGRPTPSLSLSASSATSETYITGESRSTIPSILLAYLEGPTTSALLWCPPTHRGPGPTDPLPRRRPPVPRDRSCAGRLGDPALDAVGHPRFSASGLDRTPQSRCPLARARCPDLWNRASRSGEREARLARRHDAEEAAG